MCMNCNHAGNPLKKIILLLVIMLGIGVVAYFIFTTTTSNHIIGASLPLILSFAACPLMCVVMGGLLVIMNRSKKRNDLAKEKMNPHEHIVDQPFIDPKQSLSEHLQNVHEKTSI